MAPAARTAPADHDAFLALLRVAPKLIADLLLPRLRGLGIPAPPFAGVQALADEQVSLELPSVRPDLVVGLLSPRKGGSRGHLYSALVVVEVQLSRDGDKPWRWDRYAAFLADRYRVPVFVVVLALRPSVKRWVDRKLALHAKRGRAVQAVVLGPDDLPLLSSLAEASRTPELAAFAAAVRAFRRAEEAGAGSRVGVTEASELAEAVRTALRAVKTLPADTVAVYSQILLRWSGSGSKLTHDGGVHMKVAGIEITEPYLIHFLQQVRAAEALGEARGLAQGAAEGEARGVARGLLLARLEARGLELTAAEQERVESEGDVSVLERWAARARTAVSAREVFEASS